MRFGRYKFRVEYFGGDHHNSEIHTIEEATIKINECLFDEHRLIDKMTIERIPEPHELRESNDR